MRIEGLPRQIIPVVDSIWKTFSSFIKLDPRIDDTIIIGHGDDVDIEISGDFINAMKARSFSHESLFDNELIFLDKHGRPDYLSTSFYLMQCLQEYDCANKDLDRFGRFKYEASCQYKFSCIENNIVADYFIKLKKSIPKLSGVMIPKIKSRIFFSHDIDLINQGLFQESKAALKNLNLDQCLRIMFRHFVGHAEWGNFERIMDINDEYDVKSTFFWLVEKEKGRSKTSKQFIQNSDYQFDHPKYKSAREKISIRGFENGLHKSVSMRSYADEANSFYQQIKANRNHYLQFRIPQLFDDLEKAEIPIDCSLGFAACPGFRNSYGLPFRPFHLNENREYRIIEVPLHIMDTSYKSYLGLTAYEAGKKILDLMDRHREQCILSILWHNNYFSPVKNKDWMKLYKEILDFCRQNELRSITPDEILKIF